MFVDQGENFERLLCPACGVELSVAWWQQTIDRSEEKDFEDLSVVTPCCGTSTSLNELRYEWPAGFGRFVLRALNPGKDLSDEAIERLERVLDCKLRKIWAYY